MTEADDMDGAEDVAEEQGYDTNAKPWLDSIKDAEKCFQVYHDKCDNIDKLYADLEKLSGANTDREFQIFWANLEVLKPSIYSRPPIPVVVPTFRNQKELPRKAADMLERSLVTSFRMERIDEVMRLIRDDLATNARGAAWVRYEAAQSDDGSVVEKVRYDHKDRKDFLHEPARKWREVGWVAKRDWLTREKGVKRFGDAFLDAEFTDKETDKDDEYKGEKKAAVWEIWSKEQNLVVWVSPGMDDVLDIQPPFLNLEGFFPCPMPAYGTVMRSKLVPVPDFLYYKDQIEEINELTARISALSESLRMKGFYASGSEDLGEAIEAALKRTDDNALLIPVPNFSALGAAGIKDSIVWMPVQEVANTVKELIALRQQLIQDVYEITGLSDIMRGATNPNETLGAQELKSQYGSVRVRDRQNELIRIALDIAQIAGEIMAENFQPDTLLAMSQIDDLPQQQQIQQQIQTIAQQVQQIASDPRAQQMAQQNPQQAQQLMEQAKQQVQSLQNTVTVEAVIELLRSQKMRPFVLDIETDSTIQPDENAAKQRASEFITAVGGFLAQAVPLVQQMPEAAPMATAMLQYVASQFRAGRELQGVIDEFAQKVAQGSSQPKGPSPEQMQAEADAKQEQEKISADMKKHQDEMEFKNRELEVKSQLEQEKINLAAAESKNARAVEQVKAGIPPDYSYENDAQRSQQLMGEMAASRQSHEQTTSQLAASIAQLAGSMNAPKRIIRDEAGRPVGVAPVQ